MLLPAHRDKKGISLIIGYILLIAISIVMSILVYQWLKTYVPTEAVKCDDGTSFFINSISYDCTAGTLIIDVKNNGKFSINGYFIHVSDTSGGLATIDISNKIQSPGIIYGYTNSIAFSLDTPNYLTPDPNDQKNLVSSSFDVSAYNSKPLVKVELIPTRIQEIDNKERLVSCTESKIEETLACQE